MLLAIYLGLVLFANYWDCDPVKSGQIARADQLVPYFVVNSFGDKFPGLPGLFVACIFASSLSTISSGLNAIAALIWEDFLKNHFTDIPESKKVLITKGIAVIAGILCIISAFLCSRVGTIFQVIFF